MNRCESRSAWPILSVAMLLGGCLSVGPEYEAPDVDALGQETFVYAESYDTTAPLADWWTGFDDASLNELIAAGLAENRSLAAASANLRASRAALGLARSNRLPFDDVTASRARNRQSTAGFRDPLEEAEGAGSDVTRDLFNASLSANWELDVFGRVARLIETANAELGASAAALADLQAVVIADIADAYIELRGLQAQLAVAEKNNTNLQRTLDLTRDLRDVGRVTDLDVFQANAVLSTSEASIPVLQADIASVANRLAALVGRNPAGIQSVINDNAPLPVISRPLAIGEPADLLRRRPDIAAAERRLAAATATIGLNIAEAFPTLSLGATIGVRAFDVDDLDTSQALNFNVGPQLAWSISNLLRARQRTDAAVANTDMAFAMYEQTVLDALAETESA
ncbi:MAG: efflux transporter outer membrane subunit, partial [Pseudomonadota bacterium]